MNPNTDPKQETTTDTGATKEDINFSSEEGGSIASVSSSNQTFEEIRDRVVAILSELPDYVSSFFGEYQKPIVTVGLVVAALVTVRVTLAVVDAINDIPLLSPFLELVGIGYSAWFVYRYLLRASNRQELLNELNSLKDQVVGKSSSR
jgi:hypothetical protein